MLSLKYCPVGIVGLLTRFTCAHLIRKIEEGDLSCQHFKGGRWRPRRVGDLDFTMFYCSKTSFFPLLWFPKHFFLSKTFQAVLLSFNHDWLIYFAYNTAEIPQRSAAQCKCGGALVYFIWLLVAPLLLKYVNTSARASILMCAVRNCVHPSSFWITLPAQR